MGEIFTTTHKLNKYCDHSDLIHFLPRNIITSSPTNTSMEFPKRKFRSKAKKVDLMLDKNITFDWKVALSIIMISDYSLKLHMEIIRE